MGMKTIFAKATSSKAVAKASGTMMWGSLAGLAAYDAGRKTNVNGKHPSPTKEK